MSIALQQRSRVDPRWRYSWPLPPVEYESRRYRSASPPVRYELQQFRVAPPQTHPARVSEMRASPNPLLVLRSSSVVLRDRNNTDGTIQRKNFCIGLV